MDTKRFFEFSVVMAPAICCSLLMCWVELVPVMRRIGSEHYDDIHMVEFAKEMTGHGAFYGSALATVLGYQKESYLAYGIATMWFAFCTFSAYSLVMRIKELEQRKGDGSKVNREENFNV